MRSSSRVKGIAGALLIGTLCSSAPAAAQTVSGDADLRRNRTALWTVVGAAAGFGVGIWAGLHAFDDAIDSDRKVWTTAILSAAGGGVAGFLIGRRGARPALGPTFRTVPDYAIGRELAPRHAPLLGNGGFAEWLRSQRTVGRHTLSARP
jgi:hypothetical protein